MINVPLFNNPEILQIQELPAKINHKCIYYSLGLLIIYCMFGKFKVEKEKEMEISENIKSISSTKLYFFLERCLNNLDERCLLFV